MNEGDASEGAHAQDQVPSAPARQLEALASAFAFLTRLPVPRPAPRVDALARSLMWFPAVGLVLGAAQALAGHGLAIHLSSALSAVIVVALSALLTGALHLDGLADVFDGLGGGRGDPARALSIMRDSRIGSFGALALVLAVIAKIAAIEALLSAHAWRPILLAPVAARAAAVLLIACFPYARPEGLGKRFHQHARAHHVVVALLLAALIAWGIAPMLLLVTAATWLFAALFALWLRRRLGGLTGDTYGAAIELCELTFLAAASAMTMAP